MSAVYAVTMADDETPPGLAGKAGAIIVVLLALGLLFIGADILTGGKLTCPSFVDALRGFDGPVMLTVQRLKGGRSSQANRYYWGVVVELIFKALKEGGIEITREGTHELLKMRFLTTDLRLGVEGEVVTMMRSTTELA